MENAVRAVLAKGYRTTDITLSSEDTILGTKEMTEKVIEEYLAL